MLLLFGQSVLSIYCRLFLLQVSTSHHADSSMHDSLNQTSTLHDNDKLDQVEENDEVAHHRHHLEQDEECLAEIVGLNTCVAW